jgi:DNA-binding transcriptional ArsR family regulator
LRRVRQRADDSLVVMTAPTTTTAESDWLSITFAALADPTRRAILTRLADGEATVGQLAEPFALTQQAVSKHIKVLERAGLISRSRSAQARPCRIELAQLDHAAEWIGRHRQQWRDRYDRLDQHLSALRAGSTQADESEAAT